MRLFDYDEVYDRGFASRRARRRIVALRSNPNTWAAIRVRHGHWARHIIRTWSWIWTWVEVRAGARRRERIYPLVEAVVGVWMGRPYEPGAAAVMMMALTWHDVAHQIVLCVVLFKIL